MTRRIGVCGAATAFAALLTFAALGSERRAAAQETNNHAALGGYLFKTYCATCHGTSARGDGPLAGSMRRKPARNACCLKSGVVSMRTVCPSYSTAIEGRRRLSRGSSEVHTLQSQPRVGTPMLVPDPSTVSLIPGI